MDSPITESLVQYAEDFSGQQNELLEDIARATDEELQYADMLSGYQVTGMLQLLVRLIPAQHILEVGTFTGFGTIAMAQAAQELGKAHIVTLDMNTRYAAIAQRYFKRYQGTTVIEQRMGAALDTIADMTDEESFDLIFVDADKANYPTYFQQLFDRLEPGGCMVFDNAFWSGEVLEAKTRKSKAIHRLNQILSEHPQVQNLLLTVRDGLHIARKIAK
jgi:caffeoyl-CoA O-methyltransferase